MSERAGFLLSFRARLIILLASFLLLTIIVVLVLDQQVQNRVNAEVERQSMQVNEAVSGGFGDLVQAVSLALQNLSNDTFLYSTLAPGQLPPTIEHIIVTDEWGNVNDTTVPALKNKQIPVPPTPEGVKQGQIGDPVAADVEIPDSPHGGETKTYMVPFRSDKGLYWIVIVQQQEGLTRKIDDASQTLARKNHELSDIRLGITTGLLVVALGISVIIGWRFTRPVKKLAQAARRVAAGDLDFRVNIDRRDELGQLATTINEMIADLKSKRVLEEKLNQSERAAVIGRLTQGVAHEIRNPLNVLNLSIDHVGTKFAPQDETKRKQFIRILSSIKDEIVRLNRMVTDLLNYGRPAQLSVQTIDMVELLEETMAFVRPQADEQGVEITVQKDAPVARVLGDAERLKSCMSNIAINALQAMPAGGRLIARVHRSDGVVEVSISDTGVGITDDSINKIFEPYFSTKQAGFGLGLAVTKKIVEEHSGSVDVRSHVNSGTTFTVKLPVADESSAAGELNSTER